MENILDKNISIENIYGNTIMSFKIDNNGNIIDTINCDIADIENDTIRLQATFKKY